MEYGDPIKAEVTWNNSKTYRFAGNSQLVFKQGKTQVVKDTELIKRCMTTAGFAVRVLKSYDRPEARQIRAVEGKRKYYNRDETKKQTKKTTKKKAKKKATKKKAKDFFFDDD